MQGIVFLDKLENELSEDMQITYSMVETMVDPVVIEFSGDKMITYGVSVTKTAGRRI